MMLLSHAWVRILLATLGVVAIVVVAVQIAASRYAREQRRRGLWDKNGPLHPTEAPEDESTKNLRRLTGDDWRPY